MLLRQIRLKNQCSKTVKCHTGGKGGARKRAKKVKRIIWVAPFIGFQSFNWRIPFSLNISSSNLKKGGQGIMSSQVTTCRVLLDWIARLDCWIAQSGLQSSKIDRIVIDNPKLKLDFGFWFGFGDWILIGLAIHFEKWIWIWLIIQRKWIEQQPDYISPYKK